MADPIVSTTVTSETNEEKKIGSSGIFGGGEDIFDNEELFHSVDGGPLKKSEKQENDNLDLEIDIDEDPQGVNEEDKGNEIQEGEIVEEEKFDPIFGNEDEKNEDDEEEEENIPTISEVAPKQVILSSPTEKISQHIPQEEEQEEEIEEEIEVEQLPQEKENITTPEEEKIEQEPEKEESDLMKKFGELLNKTRDLYAIAQMEDGEYVEMIGGSTGTSQIVYNLWLINEDDESQSILISKIETNNETQEEQQNNLQFKGNTGSLEIFLDEVLLYDEIQDLQDDPNKKMQVVDKLNKFIFLVSEELKIYERDRKEKERMEQERKKLRDIFRNF